MSLLFFFFFFNDTATTEIYTLSLHDALPISRLQDLGAARDRRALHRGDQRLAQPLLKRSEEHTSELQSHSDLVCRLLLEKKKKKSNSAGSEESDSTLVISTLDLTAPALVFSN